eukprot:scaffold70636_cov51-Phaeocystis_antarctica.AAC.2
MMRGEVRARRRGGRGGEGGESGVHGKGPKLEAGGQGRRRAHKKHVPHECDAGGVEAQRLVERNRALPSQMQGIRSGVRCGSGGGEGVGATVWRKRRARRGPN